MIRGTTPTMTFTLPTTSDLVKVLWITFSQNYKELFTVEMRDCVLSGNQLEVTLTQEQTLMIKSDADVEIQIRVLSNGGEAFASDIMTTRFDRILKDGKIE